jgi:hypothetical protein
MVTAPVTAVSICVLNHPSIASLIRPLATRNETVIGMKAMRTKALTNLERSLDPRIPLRRSKINFMTLRPTMKMSTSSAITFTFTNAKTIMLLKTDSS